MKIEIFFDNDNCKSALEAFRRRLDNSHQESDFEKERNKHLTTILTSMIEAPSEWDKNCQVNIQWIGRNFLSTISNAENLTRDFIDKAFSLFYRFLFELYLSINGDLTIEFERARKFGLDRADDFSSEGKETLNFAIKQMPISLLKQLFSSEHIQSTRKLLDLQEETTKREEKWKSDLDAKERRVTQIEKNLQRHEQAFNFVGLHQGFENLSKQKNIEKRNTLVWLKLFGSLILLPAALEIAIIILTLDNLEKTKAILLLTAIPAVSATLLLIYYFRILLSNYKSITSQLLQLDLRKTLCAFIQDYANYSSELKQKDKDALAKFENIIFSSLVADDSKIPSTFDGIEQISNLVKSIK